MHLTTNILDKVSLNLTYTKHADKQQVSPGGFGYLEDIAKSHNLPAHTIEETDFDIDTEARAISVCSKWYAYGITPEGKGICKAIYCGREWCKTCGRNGSVCHRRKMGRLWANWFSLKQHGYLVFTIPSKHWQQIGKIEMTSLTTYIQGKLKRDGYDKGFSRWHFAGDKQPGRWQPHLNIVIEAGYLPPPLHT